MLARTSTIRHRASGVTLETPLLIPSFSSKGFARSKKEKKSEIPKILEAAGEFLTEAFLISAYDIYYGHLPPADSLTASADLIYVDSGGYEVSTDRDYSSVIDPLPLPDKWDIEKLYSVLDAWPDEKPAVIVSYDHHEERKPFADQVSDARKLAAKYSTHLHCLLLKPETDDQHTLESTLRHVLGNAEDLGSFDVIGVTEKELGNSMLKRMEQLAKLRLAMDNAEVKCPIHVFGALDPVSVCLYFLAGAEIFDGLTWLRYGYSDGRCVYTHNLGALKFGIHTSDDLVRSRAMAENYYQLQELQHRLREFVATKNFDKLHPHSVFLSGARDSLETKLGGAR
jgi:hypothetical protein